MRNLVPDYDDFLDAIWEIKRDPKVEDNSGEENHSCEVVNWYTDKDKGLDW